MTTVTISEFRNNLSEYIRRSKYKGEEFIVVDEKKKENMVRVSPAKTKSKDKHWKEYMKLVRTTYGMLSKKEDSGRKALIEADKRSIRERLK